MANTRNIITDPENIRKEIIRKLKNAIRNKFPITAGKFVADLDDLEVKRVDMPHARQRNILLSKGNASDAVYVDLNIKYSDGNKSLYKLKNHRLVNIPYFTNRYTMIVDGNEYSIVNQMRTKSGVYTRKRDNDELESSFNLSKGANFKLIMEPDSGHFKVNMLGSVMPMYALLKILGAPDGEIRSALGSDLFSTNENVTPNQMERVRTTLYKKLVSSNSNLGTSASASEKEQKIREYFSNTKLDSETTKITLGKSFTKVNYSSILEAAKKILRVYNDKDDVDERDNLEFQHIYSVEDILQEVIDKNKDAVNKIASKLKSFTPTGNEEEDQAKLKSIFSPVYFSKPIRNFITTSSISRLPSQINPMEIMDTASIVTRLGEGAISSERAVPEETRSVNYSYMGSIDPVATPESSKVGIDNHVTISAKKGDDNEFYKEVRNTKTGKLEEHRAIDLHNKVVGFPDPLHTKGKEKDTDVVPAVHKGNFKKVKRRELDYQIPSPHDLNTVTTATLPFINANQANRLVMGAKHVQQAMPLKDPESRLVNANISDVGVDSTVKKLGGFLIPKSPVDGTVSKISDDFIHIKDSSGKVHKVDYEHDLPLATKTLLDNPLLIKKGDRVKKGQELAGSNFTKDGELAVGKTLSTGYMPYHGMNHEDGIVISEDTAKKMTSVHSEKITVRLDKMRTLDKSKYTSLFPTKFTQKQLNKLDSDGVVKKGATLEYGDPVVLVLEDNSKSRTNQILGQLHKSLKTPFKDCSEVYEDSKPAKVLQVSKRGTLVTVMLKVEKPMAIGDKLAGSYGNKGVVTKILPTDQMPTDEEGNSLDVLLSPAGVPSRINPAQILESSLGKVAAKTGKKYDVENFSRDDYVKYVKDEMKKHGVKDKETVTDPITGKKIPKVFVGKQYMHKLFKTSDSNYSARGIDGPYDQDDAPTGSGEMGPKALGGMEVNALIAHNARNFMKDASALRSSKNADFWNSFKYGQIAHMPTEKKTFNRFMDTLKQAGVKVDRKGGEFSAGPLTDNDIKKMSQGEVKNARRLNAKDLSPEKDGLFDERITGGMQGTKWGHIDLKEPVVNPVFKDAAGALLGMTSKELENSFLENGGSDIKKKLNAIDTKKELSNIEDELNDPKLKGSALDKKVKKYKYLKALNDKDLKPGDAYVLSKVPVTPPMMRPVTVGKTGDVMENDANYLYRDLILQNNSFKDLEESGVADEEDIKENRKALSNRVSELTGFMAPKSAQLAGKGVKGAASFISGDTPKQGYFQKKVVYSKMNTSGRSTIVPDNTLGLDEVGLPEEAAWEMYKPFIIRRMVKMGYSSYEAKKQVEEKSDTAKTVLQEELGGRPVVINRAPTLWRHSILAAKPKLRSDKNLHVNTLWEKATNQDYDGDAEQIHVPVSDDAVKDAFNMLPSKQLFSDKKPGDLLMAPTNEPIMGLYKATENLGGSGYKTGNVKKFKTEKEAWDAYHSGSLRMTDLVEIGS